jgi:hypothetical protein
LEEHLATRKMEHRYLAFMLRHKQVFVKQGSSTRSTGPEQQHDVDSKPHSHSFGPTALSEQITYVHVLYGLHINSHTRKHDTD